MKSEHNNGKSKDHNYNKSNKKNNSHLERYKIQSYPISKSNSNRKHFLDYHQKLSNMDETEGSSDEDCNFLHNTRNENYNHKNTKKYDNLSISCNKEEKKFCIKSETEKSGASNNNNSDYNIKERLELAQGLNVKYNKLKQKYRKERDAATHWRKSYNNLLKYSITFDETIKTLIEENRIHQEYIINLEKKNSRILNTCNNITNDFHTNLFFNINNFNNTININNVNPNSNNLSNYSGVNYNTNSDSFIKLFQKNFNEIINDYKKQIDLLSEEKDSLFSNLSLSRHQHLQMTLKMEEIQNRIFYLDKLRLEDLQNLYNTDNVKNNTNMNSNTNSSSNYNTENNCNHNSNYNSNMN